MKFAILQLDNSVRGCAKRFDMINALINQCGDVDFVILPELSTSGYIPNYEIWNYKELNGIETKEWAVDIAKKYGIHIGCGYVEYTNGEYYNSYLIANPTGLCGFVRKEEPESNIFKREKSSHIINTPLGKIGIGICYDSHRASLYDGIKNENPIAILMPHAWAMSIDKNGNVMQDNISKTDFLGKTYSEAFHVPVIFANARGEVDRMPGITGRLMRNYQLRGQSSVYFPNGSLLHFLEQEICIFEADISTPGSLNKTIDFYDGYIDRGSALFRNIVLPLDIKLGIKDYERNKA